MTQRQGYEALVNDPESHFGRLLLEVVNDLDRRTRRNRHNITEHLDNLEHYGDLSQETLPNDLITDREAMIIDPTLWGMHFSKITLYYLMRYTDAVKDLHEKNPIRSRVLGLISSIAFHLEACTGMTAKYLETRSDRGENYPPPSATNTQSRQAKANRSVEKAFGDDYTGDQAGMTWNHINFYLSNSFLKYSVKLERSARNAFYMVNSFFFKLGSWCAMEANKLFEAATPLMMKTQRSPGAARPESARHQNLVSSDSDHDDCNFKYRLLREYMFRYHKETNGTTDKVKIDIRNIKFGDDLDFEHAKETMKRIHYNLNFWKICKNDLEPKSGKGKFNLDRLDSTFHESETADELDGDILRHIKKYKVRKSRPLSTSLPRRLLSLNSLDSLV